MAEADSPETRAALRAHVERAMALGIFGAPSFTVDGELFWGQERMEQAIEAAQGG